MRLLYFDLKQGNNIALQCLAEHFGWPTALKLACQLKLRLWTNNPFGELNRQKPPSREEKLSQRQMVPLVVLYQLMAERYPRAQVLQVAAQVSQRVAIAFLRFNVPQIHHAEFKDAPRETKLAKLKSVTLRFFNAKADLKLDHKDNFHFTVNTCYFARYAKLLGMPELAPLFCAADKLYFDNYQPEVQMIRTVTLATDEKPCDFYFKWRSEETDKEVEQTTGTVV